MSRRSVDVNVLWVAGTLGIMALKLIGFVIVVSTRITGWVLLKISDALKNYIQ